MNPSRGFYRSYPGPDKRSARITRFHVVREDGRWAGQVGYCGQRATDSRTQPGYQSRAVIVDPLPLTPPAGLTWCPPCLGWLVAVRGRTHTVAAIAVPAAGAELVPTGVVIRCCGDHVDPNSGRYRMVRNLSGGLWSAPVESPCCDPTTCGPCCPDCPTCPLLAAGPAVRMTDEDRRLQLWLQSTS